MFAFKTFSKTLFPVQLLSASGIAWGRSKMSFLARVRGGMRLRPARILSALSLALIALGMSLTAAANPPLQPQFAAAQSVVPSGSLSYPYRVAVDAAGNVYISNTQGNEVLKETLSNGVYSESVVVNSGLATPYGVAVDSSGNVYVADNGNNRVLKETPSAGSYTQTVVTTSALSYPTGVAVDSSGNVYIADTGHGRILIEAPSGGSYTETALTYSSNFAQITGIAVDSSGNIYVSDIDNQAVYEETYSAGSYTPSTVPTSGLNYPYDIAVDTSGNLYISDFSNKRIVEETYSGGSYTQSVFPTVNLGGALGIAIDAAGDLYIADTFGFNIKEETLAGGVFGPVNVGTGSATIDMIFSFQGGTAGDKVSVSAGYVVTQGKRYLDFRDAGTGNCNPGQYVAGDVCYIAVNLTPDYPGQRLGSAELFGSTSVLAQGPLVATGVGPQINFLAPVDFFAYDVIRVAGSFSPYDLPNPFDAAVDGSGNVYVVDYNNNAVYKETLSAGGYTQSVVASGLNNPEAIALDGAGNVYIVDSGNNQILKETNFGGTWTGTAIITGLNFPTGVAVDWLGNVYFSSFNDNAVYKVTLSQGVYGSPANLSFVGLLQPRKIAVDGSGNVYVADTGNSRVVMETLSGGSYTQTTLGSGMSYPYAVAVDASGSVYVGDTTNSRILKESLVGGVYTQSVLIPGPPVYGIVLDGAGNMYFPDSVDATVFRISFNTWPSFSYASSNVGTQSSDSPQSFSVINTGNAPLSFQVPSSGTNPGIAPGYTLDSSTTCPQLGTASSAGSVPAGSACTYAVDFIPQTGGTNAGSLILSDNNLNVPGATQSISLTGSGVKLTPSVTVSATPSSPEAVGTSISLVATVSGSGLSQPTGSVRFYNLHTYLGSSTISNGQATLSLGTLPAGRFQLTGQYQGDGDYELVNSSAIYFTVNRLTSAALLTVTPGSVTVGHPVTLKLVVTGSGPTPTGSVSFNYGASEPAVVALSGGTAIAHISPAKAGNQRIVAQYSGDSNYVSTSQTGAVTVAKVAGAVTLISSANPGTKPSPIAFTVKVAADSLDPTPTGTVKFFSLRTLIGTVAVSGGTATLSISTLPVGESQISAQYSGDADYDRGFSNLLFERVKGASPVSEVKSGAHD